MSFPALSSRILCLDISNLKSELLNGNILLCALQCSHTFGLEWILDGFNRKLLEQLEWLENKKCTHNITHTELTWRGGGEGSIKFSINLTRFTTDF